MSKRNQPSSSSSRGPTRGTLVPTRKVQDNSANYPADQELVEQLQAILDGEHVITVQELKAPKDSRRIFSINGLVATLITRASFISLAEAHSQISAIARNHFCDPRLHPMFATTTAFAAAVEYFLCLYDGGPRPWSFTITDILSPDPNRVRRLLWALLTIVGCTSKYEMQLQDAYHKINVEREQMSQLWDEDVRIKTIENDQDQLEISEASDCEIARERLAQKGNDDAQSETALNAVRVTAEKIFKLLEEKTKKDNANKEEKRQLLMKLALLEEQCVTDQDQQALTNRMAATKDTKKLIDADLRENDERRKKLMREIELLKASIGDAETIHEKYLKSKKNDYSKFIVHEKDLRGLTRELNSLNDEVASAQAALDSQNAKVATLRALLKEKEEEIKSNHANQRRAQVQLERNIKELENSGKVLAKRHDDLRVLANKFQTELATLEQQRQKSHNEFSQHISSFKAKCLAECDEVRAQKAVVEGKVAELKKFFVTEMGRTMGDPPTSGHIRDYLPVSTREVYVNALSLLKRGRSQSRSRPAAGKDGDRAPVPQHTPSECLNEANSSKTA